MRNERDKSHVSDNTFSKVERLRHKKIIEELFKNGSSSFLYPFLLKFLPIPQDDQAGFHQLLISVPKKHIRKAHQRNLIKRRIREVYRTNKEILYPSGLKYYIAIIYVGKGVPAFDLVSNKLIKVLKRLPVNK